MSQTDVQSLFSRITAQSSGDNPNAPPDADPATLAQFERVFADLQACDAAYAKASALLDPNSVPSQLLLAFETDRAAFLTARTLSAYSEPAAQAARAAWLQMQASHAAMMQWVDASIPKGLRLDVVEILALTLPRAELIVDGIPRPLTELPQLPTSASGQAATHLTSGHLSPDQVRALSASTLASLGPAIASFSDAALAALSAQQAASLTAQQVTALGPRLVKMNPAAMSRPVTGSKPGGTSAGCRAA